MKNDLDYIKKQIVRSGVDSPADMDEKYVLQTLEGVAPQPVAVPPKRSHKAAVIAISSAAAVLVLAIAIGIILRVTSNTQELVGITLPGGLELKQFQTREQVTKELARVNSRKDQNRIVPYEEDYIAEEGGAADVEYGSASDSMDLNGTSDNGSTSYGETYKQVEGVDEADIIKTDGKYIYCVSGRYSYSEKNKLVIFSADGENPQKVSEITTDGKAGIATSDEATPDDFDYWDYYYSSDDTIIDLYIKDDRLILISKTFSRGSTSDAKTSAKVYDVSDIENITLLDTFTQSGFYDSSRMIGDTLYMVSSFSSRDTTRLPVCGRGDSPDELSADCIYSLCNNDSRQFLVLGAYDTLDQNAQPVCKSLLGEVDDIYCNLDHLYIYGMYQEEMWYEKFLPFRDREYTMGGIKTQILKVDLSDDISFTAYAEIEGRIDDQYSLDEYDGNLRVATINEGAQDSNNLFVMDENLSVIGSVKGFAHNEQIKAVRYLGDTAYVITYEKTDPLFVIDLSKPTDPAILGAAEITGFSTMLVPIDDDTILGIGYQTADSKFTDMEIQSGVKLVLFDVSDKSAPKVLDTKVYENCTSVVQYNPKALVYNPDRDDYIIPLNGKYTAWDGNADNSSTGGVLNFKVEDDQLVEIGRCQIDDYSVDRCVYVGDIVYMTYTDENDELQIEAIPYKE